MEPVGHEAEAAKQEGNDFFRQKQYTKAVAKFSESLQHKPTDPFVLGNRAAALLALGRAEDALADAKEAIRLDPNYVKGYYRCTDGSLDRTAPLVKQDTDEWGGRPQGVNRKCEQQV